jgi:Family of unknown function (DUF5683)
LVIIFAAGFSQASAQIKEPQPSGNAADTAKFVMKKSAWGAVLRSAVVPGLGQFYNESYWKVPVVWGALGYFIYQWKISNDSYKQYRDLFSGSISADLPLGNSSYLSQREFYKDQKDLFAIFIGLAYFLNLVDSYVDAQLFDFSVNSYDAGHSLNFSMRVKF